MNVNEFTIFTSHARDEVLCEWGSVIVCKNIKCGDCGTISEFNPMLSDGEKWLCMKCWPDGDQRVLSENMIDRLASATKNAKYTHLIRNM